MYTYQFPLAVYKPIKLFYTLLQYLVILFQYFCWYDRIWQQDFCTLLFRVADTKEKIISVSQWVDSYCSISQPLCQLTGAAANCTVYNDCTLTVHVERDNCVACSWRGDANTDMHLFQCTSDYVTMTNSTEYAHCTSPRGAVQSILNSLWDHVHCKKNSRSLN